ncbi:MurR/RpiR family transcriptional regulator [Pseudocitrobacter vendiensis]|uniref:MurR/RpiR family transcriptional regulator n=1 Tax=Pseudocitrobacter vendiensis TaxID=2488306 RepID=A0ABN8T827_9ENTR|nr:MurR/RpiR family transcriptional regulator [Pseudocitrobacter vendiensis]CAH6636579.1 MurR/RpiR family transcriptional regulator [Pseudocitrobacter vendiensis]
MNTLSRSERIIYEYILCNAHRLSTLSAKTIANVTFTTTTSVNRVSKKMGFSSYTELRYKYQSTHSFQSQHDGVNYSIAENELNALCNEFKSGQHIYLYARGATLTSLNYLSRFLSIAGIPHLTLVDIHQLALINRGILLLVSKSGETADILDMARNAKRKNLRVIAITQANSSLCKLASRAWHVESNENVTTLYKRETQITILNFIDGIGYQLLDTAIS